MLEALLKKTITKLKSFDIDYALMGGIVSSFYREEIRTTQDINIAILTSVKEGEKVSKEVLFALGMKPKVVRLGTLRGEPTFLAKKTEVALIGGRVDAEGISYGVDFILSSLPWVEDAVSRAQGNLLDFTFATLPALTVEDIIVSKLYSFKARSDRFKDLDDIKSIFEKGHSFDFDYIKTALIKHKLSFPEVFEEYLSVEVRRVSKKQRRKRG